MNKYFKLLTKCVLSAIVAGGICLLDPSTIAIIVFLAGAIWAGKDFLAEK